MGASSAGSNNDSGGSSAYSRPKRKPSTVLPKYSANEFSGTGKATRTKSQRDLLRLRNLKVPKVPTGVPGSTFLNATQKLRQKTLDINIDYFEGLKKRGAAKNYELSDKGYKQYMADRQAGKITASGNIKAGFMRDGDGNIMSTGNDGRAVEVKNIGGRNVQVQAPTEAEVSQSSSTDTTYDARKTKRRGRRMTILTRNAGNFTLSKPTLLGV
jgi:hypothetical protein